MAHDNCIPRRAGRDLLCAAFFVLATSSSHAADTACTTEVGRIVSRHGDVEFRRGPAGEWQPAKLETRLCDGDDVRTAKLARAALFIRPENIVRLDQRTAVRLRVSENETLVEFIAAGQQVAADPDCGAAYFISRFPRRFGVKTRYVNADIDGTEFLVRNECSRSVVAVLEGRVRARPADGGDALLLTAGESGAAGNGMRGAIRLPVAPKDQVHWLIHTPRSARGLASGAATCADADAEEAAACESANVESALAAGATVDAFAAIERLANLPDGAATAKAFRALLTLQGIDAAAPATSSDTASDERDRRARAAALAAEAVALDAKNPRAWLATSYARQAQLDLDGALAAAQEAAKFAPDGFHRARIAELQLALGNVRAARQSAHAAVFISPEEPRAHQMLGFAQLASQRPDDAEPAFERAVELDDQDPYARLGLGLAKIRRGRVADGRADLEIAVALDPRDAFLRGYLGRAYFDEGGSRRMALAGDQLAMAKALDPLDPTPWLHEGVRLQWLNRPMEALAEFRESIERNDHRAVYRASQLLDRDLAERLVQRGQTYETLGLSQLAQQEAASAIEHDPTDSAAHRALSRSLSYAPRQEINRVSETLVAKLLQPTAAYPIDTRAATSNLGMAPGAEPLLAGATGSSSLLGRDGYGGLVGITGGNRGTLGGEASVYGQSGRLSMQAGVFGYRSDGIRANDETGHRIASAMVDFAVNDAVGVQLEARGRHSEHDNLGHNFERTEPTDIGRRQYRDSTTRLGLRLAPSASTTVLLSVTHLRGRDIYDSTFPNDGVYFRDHYDYRGTQTELQVLGRAARWSWTAGLRYADIGRKFLSTFDTVPSSCPPPACDSTSDVHLYNTSAYGYATWHPMRALALTAGAAFDGYKEAGSFDKSRINPKFGLRWSPTPTLAFRATEVWTLKRAQVANATLEPTHVAGFGQFYDDLNGTTAVNRGIGVDWQPDARTTLLAEVVHRKYERPRFNPDLVLDPVRETVIRAIANRTIGSRFAVGIEATSDLYSRRQPFVAPGGTPDAVPLQVLTTALSPSVRWFHDAGWFAISTVNVGRQRVVRDAFYTNQGTSNFETLDLAAGWRRPGSASFVAIEVRNAFDRRFPFQDDSFRASEARPDLVRFLPVRMLWVRAGLEF